MVVRDLLAEVCECLSMLSNPSQYLVAYKNRRHFSLADASSIVNMTLLRGTNVKSVSEVLKFAYELFLTNMIDF